MKKTQSKSDKALEVFFNDCIETQKANGASPEELSYRGSELIKKLRKRFYESALQGEMDEHLGYAKGKPRAVEHDNLRNAKSSKKVITEHGSLEIDTPRDRHSACEPQIIAKHQRRLPGFNQKVLYLYGQGSSHLHQYHFLKYCLTTCNSLPLILKRGNIMPKEKLLPQTALTMPLTVLLSSMA